MIIIATSMAEPIASAPAMTPLEAIVWPIENIQHEQGAIGESEEITDQRVLNLDTGKEIDACYGQT
jgi:hypothetical protein